MDNKEHDKKACMACSCPCEAHKEHNHSVGGPHKDKEAGTCSTCGQEHKSDGSRDCGCK